MYTGLGRSARLERTEKEGISGETPAVPVNSLTAEKSEKAQGCFWIPMLPSSKSDKTNAKCKQNALVSDLLLRYHI